MMLLVVMSADGAEGKMRDTLWSQPEDMQTVVLAMKNPVS